MAKYTNSQIKKHKEYCISLGARRGARYKPMQLVEQQETPIRFSVTRLTSNDIEGTFLMDPYSMIHSKFNYYTYKKTRKNLKYIRQYIEKTYGLKASVGQHQTRDGFVHNVIKVNIKGIPYSILYIDESYYDEQSGKLEKNRKYPENWKYTFHYKNMDGNYRNRYIEAVIEDIAYNQKSTK